MTSHIAKDICNKYHTKYILKLIEELENIQSDIFYRFYNEDEKIIDGDDKFYSLSMEANRRLSTLKRAIKDE